MSVTHRPDRPDKTEELTKEVESVKAAGESTARFAFPFLQSADRTGSRGGERTQFLMK